MSLPGVPLRHEVRIRDTVGDHPVQLMPEMGPQGLLVLHKHSFFWTVWGEGRFLLDGYLCCSTCVDAAGFLGDKLLVQCTWGVQRYGRLTDEDKLLIVDVQHGTLQESKLCLIHCL